MNTKPALLFYCQHSLGMGHLVRSFSLATALSEYFQVVFLNGGPVPKNLPVPDRLVLINLPPLGMDTQGQLLSRDARYSVEEAKTLRQQQILQCYRQYHPAALLIELFPFGRKKFADELLPLLDMARAERPQQPHIFCSLRDILVSRGSKQQRHDNRAAACINQYFDAVLVHSDPRFAHMDESFHPSIPLQAEIIHTGFVSPDTRSSLQHIERTPGILVSAGGGIVGMPLFSAAVAAQAELWETTGLPMTLVAGPFLPEQDWLALQQQATDIPGLTLLRAVPSLRKLMQSHSLSISQCGYNTMMDLLATQPAAVVVPFSDGAEDEQMNRAQRLQKLDVAHCLAPSELDGPTLAELVRALQDVQPVQTVLDADGAKNTAAIIANWQAAHCRDDNKVQIVQGGGA